MGDVRPERTGWRDESLSARHRNWGTNAPALDIDFLMIEYNHSKPVALVEYKNEMASEVNQNHPSFVAIRHLSTWAGIPSFYVRYATDFSWWLVKSINDRAHEILSNHCREKWTEREWVEFLYWLRKSQVPREVREFLRRKDTKRRPDQTNQQHDVGKSYPQMTDDEVDELATLFDFRDSG